MRQQRENLKVYFEARKNTWIPLTQIMPFSAQYNARLYELRQSGMCILNKTEIINGVKNSWYKFVPSGQREMVL